MAKAYAEDRLGEVSSWIGIVLGELKPRLFVTLLDVHLAISAKSNGAHPRSPSATFSNPKLRPLQASQAFVFIQRCAR
jgi:hypothetical protein